MARIRTIKPDFFTSEDIVALSALARLLYIAIWCEADKDGRLVWKPMTFKLRYFPGDACDIYVLCNELTTAGLVILYGPGYAHIPTFKAHQHINPREAASQLPEPDATATRAPRVGTRQERDSDAQVGREGKGKEGDKRDASREPVGFTSFWQAWPSNVRKGGKAKCLDTWKKAGIEAHAEAVLSHVEQMKATPDWQKQGGAFVPAPQTYLNGRRWDGASEMGQTSGSGVGRPFL